MKNSEIAKVFRDIAQILEIKGGNVFRIRAYERAAQNIDGLAEDLEVLDKEGKLREIPGIGQDLSERIDEFLKTGKIKMYEQLKKSVPEGLLDLLNIPSIGPKTAKLFYEKLKIRNIQELERAIAKGKLTRLAGIKEKSVENISKGIALVKKAQSRMIFSQAEQIAGEFVSALEKLPEVQKFSSAGSLRRQKETVRDIDILMTSQKPARIIEYFTHLPLVKDILAQGETKASIRIRSRVQVDCRVVEERSFGAALLYFTGSKGFNIKLRQIAQRKGFKLNEYGLFRGDKFIAGKSEEEVLKALGISYIAPEIREDTGEIELAKQGKLPRLIELKDIKGDLHVHSSWSDGNNSIEEMALACIKRGYSYVAITDHSQSLKVAGGLSPAELKKKRAEIDKVNKRLKGLRILYGTEVDIDSEGRLDYNDDILKQFDIVVAAIHAGFKQSAQQLTRRITRACANKYVHIIAHPTGRLWGTREAYALNMDEVLKAAKDTNTSLEINSFPFRLDLNELNCRRAKEIGARLVINTDSHLSSQLDNIRFGVSVARRGWITAKEVLNTLELDKMLEAIRK